MTKQLVYDQEAREHLQAGIDKVANAVKVTLGPRGRNVIIDKATKPQITNDGVTIAKSIELTDAFENIGAKLIKEVASKTQDNAGDGTTTATVIAQELITQGLKNTTAGANPMEVKRGIQQATTAVITELKKHSKPVKGDAEIAQVGTISANNDKIIGSLIAEAMSKVGSNGVITVEEAKGLETHLEVVEGMEFDQGYLSPYMATDEEKMEASFENAHLLVTDKKISAVKDIVPALELTAREGKPLVIIADDVEGEALTALVLNILRGSMKVCAIKAPGFGDEKKALLQDIATLTGAEYFAEDTGVHLEAITKQQLGVAKKMRVSKDKTVIVEGAGDKQAINDRVGMIQAQISNATGLQKEKLQKRLAKLTGGVAVINVGAATETELKEKKMRIDDALHATKAAVEEGVVPGGGLALYRVSQTLKDLKAENSEQQVGVNIVLQALQAPIRQIATNAGVEAAEVLSKIRDEKPAFGYNARTNNYEDLEKAGVIDPTKVVRNGVQAATSIAAMVLTTETLIADFDEEKGVKNPAIII
ncbi:MAG: chaperonin GroEL [Candidatus Woesearchaeota archaeon]